MINLSLLKTGVSSLGIDLADECIDLLDSFSDMVAEQNKSFNLTALTAPDAFTEKHIVDSIIEKGADFSSGRRRKGKRRELKSQVGVVCGWIFRVRVHAVA